MAGLTPGDSRSVSAALREEPLKLIVGTRNSFCALRRSGTVVTWGHDLTALDASCPVGLADVETVVPSDYAFAAVRADGTVVTWGDPEGGAMPDFRGSRVTRCLSAFFLGFGMFR